MQRSLTLIFLIAATSVFYSCGKGNKDNSDGGKKEDSVQTAPTTIKDTTLNPFRQFVGKPYGTYHYAIRDTMRRRYDSGNPAFVHQAVAQMRSLPDALHDGQWKLEADFLETNYEHDYQHGDSAVFVHRLLKMRMESRRYHNRIWEIRIVRRLFDFYKENDVNGVTIEYARQLEHALSDISLQEFPDVVDYKYRLGEFYMKFGDYHRAEQYCRYVVKAPMENAIQEIFIQSRNSLGIIYRDYYHNLDESDRWFRSIIDFQKRYGIVDREQQWLAVANGNIGRNSLLRGQPAKAIPLMLASFRVLYSSRNYVYTYTIASALTDAYCQTNQFDKALRFLKITRLCADSIHDPLAINMFNYYKSACKYYAATKNGTLSGRYFDSAFLADKVYQRRFDESRFLQVEQKQSHLEWETQNEKARANYRSFLHAAVISVVIFCLLVICVVLYVRKRKAYRLLACKTQEWGGRQDPYTQPQTDLPEPEKPAENPVTMSILEYMEHSKCYLQNDLTLDSLARNLGMNRTYLSNAIHDIDINFNALVNKYRIQQAVKILAEEKNINLEELAYKVGFNNRKSFYNAFTAITGLSPTQFRRKLCTPCH